MSIQEDSILENGQFCFYAAASIIALVAGLGYLKKRCVLHGLILLVFAFLLCVVSLEEISWGQRILKIGTPGFFQHYNIQHEISIHNLTPIQKRLHAFYVLVGSIFSFGWIPAGLISLIKRLPYNVRSVIRVFAPRWYLMLYFLPVTLLYHYFNTRFSGQPGCFVVWRDQEPVEFLLALGFLLYSAACSAPLIHTAANKECVFKT